MKEKDLIKIISLILENDVYEYEELIRLIIELVKTVNKPPEIKTVPEPYPVYSTAIPSTGLPQYDWTKVTCSGDLGLMGTNENIGTIESKITNK